MIPTNGDWCDAYSAASDAIAHVQTATQREYHAVREAVAHLLQYAPRGAVAEYLRAIGVATADDAPCATCGAFPSFTVHEGRPEPTCDCATRAGGAS